VLESSCDEEVEIVVGDNASPDETREVVASFADRRIRYYRNSSNLGPELNILKLLEYAQGDWIFFLTDDDLMNPNCIPEIFNIIHNYPHVGVIRCALDLLDEETGKAERIYTFHPKSRGFAPGRESLVTLFMACHVLSGITVRRDLVDIEGYKRQIGRHLYSPLWIPAYAMKYAGCYYTNYRLVTHRVKNYTYWEYPSDFFIKGLIQMVYELLPEPENQGCVSDLIEQIVDNTRNTLLASRLISITKFARHVVTLLNIQEVRSSWKFWRNLLVSLPLVLVPSSLIRLAGKIKWKILRTRQV